ncbi:MAG TPA: DUF3467 domain-containing protein [Nitrospiria bacterium]|nr:DUF3467 domain-containing protein [Nitrospiria bacterium]
MTQQPAGPQITIEIDETVARGTYANLALISHTESEFLFDFLFLFPQQPKAKVLARIISSPGHTKRLLTALQDNIKRYEEQFGEIKVLPDEQKRIGFAKP